MLTVFIIRFVIETGFSWSDQSPHKLVDDFSGKANGTIENILILVLGSPGPIAILIRCLQAFVINPEKLMTDRGDAKQDQNKVDPSYRKQFAKNLKDVSSYLDAVRIDIFIVDLDCCSKKNVIDIL
ncbi:MAG: hypothetical protein ACJAUP_000751 [Cellvibrionaceae bacterium]|jgi:hypothetical protein